MRRGFDRLARPYRWMEYATFGRALERCRFHLLPELATSRSALLLGDGDGRFAARLLGCAPQVEIVAVDSSPAMLAALHARCVQAGAGVRVEIMQADLAVELPAAVRARSYDLLVTHFVLDCLSTAQVEGLAKQIAPQLRPGARWVISEFQVPATAMKIPARMLMRALYTAFRLLTGVADATLAGLSVRTAQSGLRAGAMRFAAARLLVSEMWTMSADKMPDTPATRMETR